MVPCLAFAGQPICLENVFADRLEAVPCARGSATAAGTHGVGGLHAGNGYSDRGWRDVTSLREMFSASAWVVAERYCDPW